MVPRALIGVARTRRLVAGCFVCGLLLIGCGGSSHQPQSSGTVVGVTERDFHIATSIAQVTRGDVTLQVHNVGPDEHELIVAPERTGGPPLRSDGFTVNEETIQNSEPGSINPQEPGHTTDLKLHLPPGRYLLFCNMEGHFMGGMHTELVVTQ